MGALPSWSRLISFLSPALRSPVLQLGAQSVLAAGLLWVWSRNLDWAEVGRLAVPRQAIWLVAVVAMAVAGSVLRAWRWKLLVGRRSPLGLVRAFWINEGANLANLVVPARVGDLLRMFWLRRWCQIPAGGSAGIVMADHAFELVVATLLLGGGASAYLIARGPSPAGFGLAAAAGAALLLLCLLAMTVLLAPRLARSQAVSRRLPHKLASWLSENSVHFDGLGPLRISPGRAAGGGAITIAAYATDGLMLWSLFGSLGIPFPIPHSLAVTLALVPGYALPSPGGAGVVELIGTLAAQAGGGLAHAAAAAGVIAFHLSGFLITAALGLVGVAVLGLPRRRPAVAPPSRRLLGFGPLAATARPGRWVGREARLIAGEWRARSRPAPEIAGVAEPPPGRGRAVMLIPGLLSGDDSLAFPARWLRHWGYRVIESGIRHNAQCPDAMIESLSRRLAGELDPGERALLIGHSKGGLLGFGIAHRHPELVERVLTLGSPLGDPFGTRWNTTVTVKAVAAILRLRGGSRPGCYTRSCTCDAMRLARAQAAPPVPVSNIASRQDGIVCFEACQRPHVSVREVTGRHNSMPVDPAVIGEIAAWLRD